MGTDSRAITLPDGRALAYSEVGPADGRPVMLFHGAPGSRLLCPDEGAVEQAGVHLVVPDRPGYGRSDPKPGRRLLEWPADVEVLADALGFDDFGVIGWSAGAAHALACGVAIPDRLAALVVASCPCSAEEVPALLDVVPGLASVYEGSQSDRLGTEELVAAVFAGLADDPKGAWYDEVKAAYPGNPVFAEPRWDANFLEHGAEGFRQGSAGYATDLVACGGPWGFALADVSLSVEHRYGDDDTPMTLGSVATLDSSLRSCRSVAWPGTGHGGIYPGFAELLELAS